MISLSPSPQTYILSKIPEPTKLQHNYAPPSLSGFDIVKAVNVAKFKSRSSSHSQTSCLRQPPNNDWLHSERQTFNHSANYQPTQRRREAEEILRRKLRRQHIRTAKPEETSHRRKKNFCLPLPEHLAATTLKPVYPRNQTRNGWMNASKVGVMLTTGKEQSAAQ